MANESKFIRGGVMLAACAALLLPASPASAAPEQQASQESSVDAYDRIHQRLTQLYDLAPDESREAFMYQGVSDESMQRWLEQARPDGTIVLLPAWPKSWDARFRLHGAGGTQVTAEVRGGALVSLEVDPPANRGRVTVAEGWVAP